LTFKRISNEIIAPATRAFTTFLENAVGIPLECIRLARTGFALLSAGTRGESILFSRLISRLNCKQRPDGGWSDPEETAWAAGLIRAVRGEKDAGFAAAKSWLRAQRKPRGGWGRHARDRARIPITGLVAALVPEVIEQREVDWLRSEWQQDFEGPVRLSYKGGFFLLGTPRDQENALVLRTIEHLAKDQNEDGGFGPWKGHPIGSDPWSTGVVLWGLSRWIEHMNPLVIEKALNWLRQTQLPSGYWPYHYLDDGTSLALIGAVSAMKALATRESSCAPLS